MRFLTSARVFAFASVLVASVLAACPVLAQAKKPAATSSKPASKPRAAVKRPAKPKPAQKPASSKPAARKPAHKPAATKPSAKRPPPQTRKPGEAGAPNEHARRVIAGVATTPHNSVEESPELRALREVDLALFSAAPSAGSPWPSEEPLRLHRDAPLLVASGLPPQAPLPPLLAAAAPSNDLTWLRKLQLPDIPVRWDVRVIRYLEFYKTNPRGRSMVAGWVKKSGRYGAFVRRTLREQGVPEDVLWLALVESGFDPTIHSPVGAAGLWQFMPGAAHIYGLTVDRWVDERLDPERSTIAAARYLSDLHKRFGNWELALAAYNMGYGGLLAAIRKYGTNDFWELGRLEAGLPLETALYVPKILAMAIVAKNCAVFGCDGVELDPAATFDKVTVGAGVSLKVVANAAGADIDAVEALNPQYPIGRTPPLPAGTESSAAYVVRVPPGTGPATAKAVTALAQREAKLDRHVVRWGESVEDIASAWHTTRSSILSLNGFRPGEQVRPGTVLLVPAHARGAASRPETPEAKPVVVVPAETFTHPDRRRIFYRVVAGDTPREIALALSVSLADLCRWNAIDISAALHDGMVLQAFVPKAATFSHALVTEEENARVLAVGSPEFFEHFESLKGRKRIEVAIAEGDTWRGLSKRYGLSLGMLERINHRSRSSSLSAGDKVVVYVAAPKPTAPKAPPPVEPEPIEEKPDRPLPVVLAEGDPSAPADGDEAASAKPKDDASEASASSESSQEAGPTILAKDTKDAKEPKDAPSPSARPN